MEKKRSILLIAAAAALILGVGGTLLFLYPRFKKEKLPVQIEAEKEAGAEPAAGRHPVI